MRMCQSHQLWSQFSLMLRNSGVTEYAPLDFSASGPLCKPVSSKWLPSLSCQRFGYATLFDLPYHSQHHALKNCSNDIFCLGITEPDF